MNEADRIRKAQEGDHDAFLALLRDHDRQIMSVVYRFTANLYDREDLYQEIFLHCFTALPNFRQQSAFSTWLYRLALNRCISYMKRHRPAGQAFEEEAVLGSTKAINWEKREKLRAVKQALGALSRSQHMAFHLHYIENWTDDQIADVLECSTGAVKSHLHRARTKVRKHAEVLKWQENPS